DTRRATTSRRRAGTVAPPREAETPHPPPRGARRWPGARIVSPKRATGCRRGKDRTAGSDFGPGRDRRRPPQAPAPTAAPPPHRKFSTEAPRFTSRKPRSPPPVATVATAAAAEGTERANPILTTRSIRWRADSTAVQTWERLLTAFVRHTRSHA